MFCYTRRSTEGLANLTSAHRGSGDFGLESNGSICNYVLMLIDVDFALNCSFRSSIFEGGVDLSYTEAVHLAGTTVSLPQKLRKSGRALKTRSLLLPRLVRESPTLALWMHPELDDVKYARITEDIEERSRKKLCTATFTDARK